MIRQMSVGVVRQEEHGVASRGSGLAVVAGLILTQASASAAQEVVLGPETLSFGALDWPETEVIGEVEDIALGPDGDLLIVDRQASRVGWLLSSGEFRGWFGQEGDGPEEFRYLGAADVHPDGRFAVVDAGHNRLVLLARRAEGLRIDETVGMEVIPWEMCFLGERIFISALHAGRVVHELDWTGSIVRSFGAPLEAPGSVSERWQPMVDRYSAMGTLLCVEERNMVVMVTRGLSRIRAFSPEGELIWEHTLNPWQGFHVAETPEGRFQMGGDPRTGRANSVPTAWLADARTLAVQVDEASWGRDVPARLEVRYFDLLGDREERDAHGLPRIAVMGDGFAVGWEDEPFPRVIRWSAEVHR